MKTQVRLMLAVVAVASFSTGCSYMKTTTKQWFYSARTVAAPRQRVYKHMVGRENYFVFGKIQMAPGVTDGDLGVVAFSDDLKPGEFVDINRYSRSDSYYALNLPAGKFRLMVVRDINGDGAFNGNEAIAEQVITLNDELVPDRVLGDCDFLCQPGAVVKCPPFRVALPRMGTAQETAYYPKGALRSLDDPIFSREMADLGLFRPAAFLERSPGIFYATEPYSVYKVPVIFVHGIDGTPRDFETMLTSLDREKYQPWFFYYPSGGDLNQLSTLFHRMFLSGNLVTKESGPIVIVAYSMGGLIVRNAFSLCDGNPLQPDVECLVTISSPLAGHPVATKSANAPVVLDAWRDLDPESAFVKGVYRTPLPRSTRYHLYYTFGNSEMFKPSENSDGVVPLSSQLPARAQMEAAEQFGFNATHTGVLKDPEAIGRIMGAIGAVKPRYPADHLVEFAKGGFALPTGVEFNLTEAHAIETYGKQLEALVNGKLAPVDAAQRHFVDVVKGRAAAETPVETAWLKFEKARATSSVAAEQTRMQTGG